MGTHYRGTGTEIRALDAYIKLLRAAESVAVRVHRHLSEDGLSVSQFGVLEALCHLGPLCQRDLGKKLLKSAGNVTLVVNNLEKRGLVERHRGTRDRRYVTVRLTARGRDVIEGIFPRHVRVVVEALGTLSAAEQETLDRLCRTLGTGASGKGVQRCSTNDERN